LALVASMAALGNVLGVIPIGLGQIPTGAGAGQIALDFSNLAVVVVAIFVGWRLGALTGLLAGIGPAIMFGFVTGSTGFISFLVPVGKALTGFTVGLIAQSMGPERRLRSYNVFLAILVGFIPEAILTWYYFVNLVPLFVTGYFAQVIAPTLALPVLIKAIGEMTIIAFLTVALVGNEGFRTFFTRFVPVETLLVPARASPQNR
jgi:LytS/YehU family sensor histidine kinase